MDNKIQSPVTQSPSEVQLPTHTPEQVTSSSSKKMWYVVAALLVIVFLGGNFLYTKKSDKVTQQTTGVQQPTMQQKTTLPRSKALGIVTGVVTATSLDAKGNPVFPVSSFSATTKTIYLAVSLNNAKAGTKVEYVRYLNGKYLDKKALKIMKQNATNGSFVWSFINPGTKRKVGKYRVKVYSNGIFEKEMTFTVS